MSGFSTTAEADVESLREVVGSSVGGLVRESGGGVVVREVGVEGVSSESESLEGSSGRVP